MSSYRILILPETQEQENAEPIEVFRASLMGTNFAGYGATREEALLQIMRWCWIVAAQKGGIEQEIAASSKAFEAMSPEGPKVLEALLGHLDAGWEAATPWKETPVLDGFEVRTL